MLVILIPNIQVQAIENNNLVISEDGNNEVINDSLNIEENGNKVIEDKVTDENVNPIDNNDNNEEQIENFDNGKNSYLEDGQEDLAIKGEFTIRSSANYMLVFKQSVNGEVHTSHNDSCYITDSNGNKTLRSTHPSVNANVYENSSLSYLHTARM